jgi:hypothetical protein
MNEWDDWVGRLTRREKDKLYPGMHTSLIAAAEKITGMDEGEHPGYVAPGNPGAQTDTWGQPVTQTNAWGQPIEDAIKTSTWGTPVTATMPPTSGTPGLAATGQSTPPMTPTGFGPQQLTPPSSVTPSRFSPSPWGVPSQPEKKLGLLDRSFVKPAEVQDPWTGNAANSFDPIAVTATSVMDMFGNIAAPEAYIAADLFSRVAGDRLNAGSALAATYGATAETGQHAAAGVDEYTKTTSLPDIRHNPGSRTYTWYDPKKAPRSVTPFVDTIPGFDWHRDRNMFNKIPGKKPKKVYKKVYRDSKQGPRYEDVYSHHEDHRGNRWKPNFRFFTGKYHGKENLSFRGTGQYRGCQVVYTPKGNVMTTGELRSTFDYGRPGTFSHGSLDIDPHNAPGGKSYRDPDLSRVF